jgi:hypothetical protein
MQLDFGICKKAHLSRKANLLLIVMKWFPQNLHGEARTRFSLGTIH